MTTTVNAKYITNDKASVQNSEWKLIRLNDFPFFIQHISTVNNAQIIKRNVSVSLHSISAIRWHYCTSRTGWFLAIGIPFWECFLYSRHLLLRSFSFSLQHFCNSHHGLGFFALLFSFCFIHIFILVDSSLLVLESYQRKISEHWAANRIQALATSKDIELKLTTGREESNNILWITITCLWSNANTTGWFTVQLALPFCIQMRFYGTCKGSGCAVDFECICTFVDIDVCMDFSVRCIVPCVVVRI